MRMTLAEVTEFLLRSNSVEQEIRLVEELDSGRWLVHCETKQSYCWGILGKQIPSRHSSGEFLSWYETEQQARDGVPALDKLERDIVESYKRLREDLRKEINRNLKTLKEWTEHIEAYYEEELQIVKANSDRRNRWKREDNPGQTIG